MRLMPWTVMVLSLVAMPGWAQEIPDRALPTVKAAPKLPKSLRKKKKAKPAPTVVRSNTWWGKRSGLSQKMLAGGGLSTVAGIALVAVGSSMANNAVDRRHFLQKQPELTEAQRIEFIDQNSASNLGKNLHMVGWVLCGAGSTVLAVGGVL